ncbi:MAG: TIGR02281 family clan AA aspartic protease [Bauldia sp.]|nr:MAG: TIGR02281 family clan AA aspartic protease [Bauldia sp.]
MSFSRVMIFAVAMAVVAMLVPKLGLDRRPAEPAPAPVAAVRKAPADPRRVALDADRGGHFLAEAVINGRSVTVMVDTGATLVALTEETARRLGIRPAVSDFTIPIATANGTIRVAPVTLDEVKVGGIRVRDVAATVVPGDALGVNLLGMSFLGRLSHFEIADRQLVLVR